MPSFNDIIAAKAPAKSWGYAALAKWHCFSDNGIVAAKFALDARILAAVVAGKVPSGWLLAYGSLNDYHVEALRKLAARRRAKPFDVTYAVKELEKTIARVDRKLSTF